MRPPGFPGNPPARMPRAPTPARSPPPRPLRGGDVAFRPTQDVGPRDQCISGLNHAGLRTPCERFAPWVTPGPSHGLRAPCERFAPWVSPGPRITRFRLAADLGRMGLDTHRVSNKVSKITSRHLVPLDRAFPAHALVHESSRARTMLTDRILTCRFMQQRRGGMARRVPAVGVVLGWGGLGPALRPSSGDLGRHPGRAVSGYRRPQARSRDPVPGGPRILTRWCVARGGGPVRCARRQRRPCGAADGLVPAAPAAPDTRRVGPRRRAVPARG